MIRTDKLEDQINKLTNNSVKGKTIKDIKRNDKDEIKKINLEVINDNNDNNMNDVELQIEKLNVKVINIINDIKESKLDVKVENIEE